MVVDEPLALAVVWVVAPLLSEDDPFPEVCKASNACSVCGGRIAGIEPPEEFVAAAEDEVLLPASLEAAPVADGAVPAPC